MRLDQFRDKMTSYRQAADSEARAYKDPQITIERLRALYEAFDEEEHRMADQVLGEWALSTDEGLRFDALFLIDDLKIGAATSALQTLAERLAFSTAPSAPYELKKVHRIIEGLTNGR